MASTLAWLDQDDEHRRQMREAIGLFRDEGAIDELGLGRIRDAFSDRLFPGTSVLWRRARYLLFVPWVYLLLERGEGGRRSPEERARALQRRLATSLKQAEGVGQGVIGASGADVRQPPDVILWAALQTWGVRTVPGRLTHVRAEAVAGAHRQRKLEDEHVGDSGWHPLVARLLPDDFPNNTAFELEDAEKELLRGLVLAPDALPGTIDARRADSLLAVLIRESAQDDIELPWRHPMLTASSGLRRAVHHAGCFSDLVHGARLLYADLVAETQHDDELRAQVDEAFAGWVVTEQAGRFDELRAWLDDLDDFWRVTRGINPRIGPAEEAFVRSWAELVLADPQAVRSSVTAKQLVVEREHLAKGGIKARLALDGSVGRDARALLPGRLTFRWPEASSIARDLVPVGAV